MIEYINIPNYYNCNRHCNILVVDGYRVSAITKYREVIMCGKDERTEWTLFDSFAVGGLLFDFGGFYCKLIK